MKNLQAAALVCGAMLLVLLGGSAQTAPKPSDISTSWQLDFQVQDPKPVRLEVPGQKGLVTFWYVEYTVSNQTNEEQVFVPDFVLYTDNGQILRAGQDVPGTVFRSIKETLNEPLLKDQADISGRILRGSNNAKQGVMIFRDIDPEAGAFDIFVGGLSGETAVVQLPNPIPMTTYDREKKKQVVEMRDKIVLSKTLDLSYSLPGAASARFKSLPTLLAKTWVMR
jgi:hypothetical protein